jgi:DNA polymerase-3 subunit alpha
VYSAFSLSRGALKVEEIVRLCKQNDMPAVAVTDINNLFGVMKIAKTFSDNGIQHIIGSQITIKIQISNGLHIAAPMIFLVQTEVGYKNLMALSTLSYKKPTLAVDGPSISIEQLKQHNEGLLCLTCGEQGPLGQLLLKKEVLKVNELLQCLVNIFNNRLYIELMRNGLADQIVLEPQFLELALKYNIPIVATNDVYYASKDMFEAHDALLCIAEGTYVSETNRTHASPHKYFKSQGEMVALFADLPEAIENTVNIAKRCSFLLKERYPILPPFTSASGLSEKDELYTQAVNGLEKRLNSDQFKGRIVDRSTDSQKLSTDTKEVHDVRDKYFARLYDELAVIEKMGFSGYFLIVADFIKFAKSQSIPVGPGRGSGAGSLVAWSLTITDIDPIRFDLIFERFLNPERISMPDFDIDFCQDRRGEVINYVLNKYGEDKVAQIITFGKLQARAVLRDVGRVLGFPYVQVDKICKLVPNNPAHPVTLQEAINSDKVFKKLINDDENVAKLVSISQKLEGLYRHASTHAAGIVIGSAVISEFVPLYYDGESPIAITQINMKYIEKAGLLKFDFLGLKTLSVIQYCCDLIKKRNVGQGIDISSIPFDDKKTFDLLCDTNVCGVFQLESGGMRGVIKKMKPDRLEDLIALVALFRPGPMDDIPKYLACKHGDEEVAYLHPKLQPILEKTYGVMVYQEQVMQIAQVLAGYTLGGADILRRAMGKKNKDEMDTQRMVFIDGAVKNGINMKIAGKIFDSMEKFASYGFNKSHSAPYALISYQTAYLKANYPLEFYAALATYEKSNTEKLTMFFQDMKNNGISILPPDINESEVNFVPENEAIRYALSSIKNVGEQAMSWLVAEKTRNGRFKSLEDFAVRFDPVQINKRQLENLIAAGVFDSLHQNRKQLFESVNEIIKYANYHKQCRSHGTRSLFENNKEDKYVLRLMQTDSDWNIIEKTQREFETIGFFMGDHPLDIYGNVIESLNLQDSSKFGNFNSGKIVRFAAVILSHETRVAKNGQKFAFVIMSDRYGIFEIPFFSDNYERNKELMREGLIVYVEAAVKVNDDGSVRLTGQCLVKLEDKDQSDEFVLRISEQLDLNELKSILTTIDKEKSQELTRLRKIRLELTIDDEYMSVILPGKYAIYSETRAMLFDIARSCNHLNKRSL